MKAFEAVFRVLGLRPGVPPPLVELVIEGLAVATAFAFAPFSPRAFVTYGRLYGHVVKRAHLGSNSRMFYRVTD